MRFSPGEIVMSRELNAPQYGAGDERVSPSVEIAEAKPGEETLREEGSAFRALVEQEVAGIYIVAGDGMVAYVNPYIARGLGYEPAQVVGRPMFEFIADSEKAAVSKRFAAQKAGRERLSEFNSTLLRRDGAPVDVLVHNNVATFRGQQASIGIIFDMSERERAEE